MSLRFSEFVFDPDRVLLLRGTEPVHLEPKAFQLLALLLSRRPSAITKAEIRGAIWPRTSVSESSLPGLVRDLRLALGDDSARPQLIRTVRGHGYAFCGAVLDEPAPTLEACRWVVLHAGREIPLPAGTHLVGRGETCLIRCASPRVSRQHARVHVAATAAFIEDLGSRNGTFLRGERVEGASEVQPGDVVCVGPEELRFVAVGRHQATTVD
jgi:DNA-binding winged helix-turn-helix (wHTH) protein